jgi:CO/xanthine dehydrogenase FAD-binding subunit
MGYARPETLSDALEILAGGKRTILAGGTDLYPATTAQTLPGDILDITGIKDLHGVSQTAAGWRIGACATWSHVIAADLPPAFDALKQAAAEVGARQIQNAGTVAGNICNASPAADGVPALLILDAEVEIAGPTPRRLPLADFITGVRRTALGPGEMVAALHIPAASARGGSGFVKLGARKYLVISIAMAAARLEIAEGRIAAAALAVGACSAVATRLPAVEARLIGQTAPTLDDAEIAAALSPIDDIRGSVAYRSGAAVELVRRAVAKTLEAAP